MRRRCSSSSRKQRRRRCSSSRKQMKRRCCSSRKQSIRSSQSPWPSPKPCFRLAATLCDPTPLLCAVCAHVDARRRPYGYPLKSATCGRNHARVSGANRADSSHIVLPVVLEQTKPLALAYTQNSWGQTDFTTISVAERPPEAPRPPQLSSVVLRGYWWSQ